MGVTVGPLTRVPDFPPKGETEAARRKRWIQHHRNQLRYITDKELSQKMNPRGGVWACGYGLVIDDWLALLQAEYDRRYLLRPAAFVDTVHSLLVRPSCK